jgi:hypothetical protein
MSRAEDDTPAETTHGRSAASALRALDSDATRTVNLTRRADAPSLETPSLVSLARAIARAECVVTVNLSGQRLDVAACHALARAAADGASFRVLDCGDCGIGDAGAAELAEVLILNARLERLYAPANGIGRDGADAVAAGAEARLGPRLRTLDLSDNEELGDAGAIALARVCRPEVAPSELRLAACGIGDAGARAGECVFSVPERHPPHLRARPSPQPVYLRGGSARGGHRRARSRGEGVRVLVRETRVLPTT